MRVLFNGETIADSHSALTLREGSAENAVWAYRQPYDEVADIIKDYAAFYPNRVDAMETE